MTENGLDPSELKTLFPALDDHCHQYIQSVLDDCKEDLRSKEDVYEAIGEFLASGGENGTSDNEIMDICDKLFRKLSCNGTEVTPERELKKVLGAPVLMNQCIDENQEDENWRSIWTDGRDAKSIVDQRKLEKAEAKLKIKNQRRTDDAAVAGSTAAPAQVKKAASTSQTLSKRTTNLEASGTNRSRDIKIENFDVSFGDKQLLSGAEMTLVYGRRYGLCGRNGIGKSTLLQMIAKRQLFIPAHITVLCVEQEVVGDDTIALDSVLECDTKLTDLTREEKQLSALKNPSDEETKRLKAVYEELSAMEAEKAPARASMILAGLGFSPEMQRKATKEFSGGWRMRIALARALFSRPDLLLLDEPTNMLDMKAIIWLENYLCNHWESTLLVVSHDRSFLNTVPTDILHFHSKRIDHYRGNFDTFYKAMKEKLKNQQREYEAQQQLRAHTQEFIDRFRYNAKRASLVQSKIKMLERLPTLTPVEKETVIVFKFPEPEPLQPPILMLDEVTFRYGPDEPYVLKNVNLNANMQSRICIVGENGCGKTTLLRILNGDLTPTSGVRHAHRNLAIGYFSQHHVDQLTMTQSPVEFMASKWPGKPTEVYRRYLGSFGITGDLSLQPVASLSGGQKSRVAFACMTLSNPHILILDEPTNHLDVETLEALADSIERFKGGVILVSHDEQLIKMVCKEMWLCRDQGVKCIEGGYDEYRALIERELAEIAN